MNLITLKSFTIKNFTYLFLLFLVYINPVYILSVKSEIFSENLLRKQKKYIKKVEFEQKKKSPAFDNEFGIIFKKDLIQSSPKLANIFISDNSNDIRQSSMEIEADIQYKSEEIFNAEGNAVMYFGNARLAADKLTYDQKNKILTAEGNIIFNKGKQYFEASNLYYDIKNDEGHIDNIYGILEVSSLNEDFDLVNIIGNNKTLEIENDDLDNLVYINSASLGLVNDFDEDKKFNLKNINLSIPQIPRWRFKSKKFNFESKRLFSDLVYFTNDPFNRPQFLLESRNFTVKIVDDKSQLISKNTWVIFDNKIKFPIGRRNIIDREPLTRWGLGSDFSEKDGWYIFRGFESIELPREYSLKLQPYFLIQRAIKGKTKYFREPRTTIFSPKVEYDTSFADYIALDLDLRGKLSKWKLNFNSSLNSLNLERFDEAVRAKFNLTRSINLNSKDDQSFPISTDKKEDEDYFYNFLDLQNSKDDQSLPISTDKKEVEDYFYNFLDLQLYSSYRESVYRGYSGDAEIYFSNGASLSNRREWQANKVRSGLVTFYDVGQFNAKSKSANELKNLTRHVLAIKYNHNFPIWEKENINKSINEDYKYSPEVIKEGLSWNSSLQAGTFFYSDGKNQSGITFSTGPQLIIGSLTSNYFDYTKLNINSSYTIKDGESSFAFDDIGESATVHFNINQQIFGPLQFSYSNYLNLDNGEFSSANYGLDLKRRAYTVGLNYEPSSESVSLRFNIFNFNYSGKSSKF